MTFAERLKQKKFVITSEIRSSMEAGTQELVEQMNHIQERVQSLGISDLTIQGWVTKSVSYGRMIKDHHYDPILLINCREKSRIDIQEFLLQAFEAGIENLLIFMEDYCITGDSLQELMFFHVDTGKFFSVIKNLGEGRDISGKALHQKYQFCIGSGIDASWGNEIPEMALKEMEELVRLGTHYFLTMPVFDLDRFEKFMDKIKPFQIPIIAEVLLAQSLEMGLFLNGPIKPGMEPRPFFEKRFGNSNQRKSSQEMIRQLVNGLKDLCQGVHFVPIDSEEEVSKYLGNEKN